METTLPSRSEALRVVQWATGNIGGRSLRHVIDHPRLELVGLWVHSADKVGSDAGSFCERPDTGVVATNSLTDIVALEADCVLYMPRSMNVDEVCALLASGANVVTTAGMFHHPASLDPEIRSKVAAACATGGTSIHSTGSSPGFISEAVPMALASIQTSLDSLTIDEFADLSQRPSPDLLFNVMGFGGDPSSFGATRFGHLAGSFGPSLRTLADALGAPLDAVEVRGEVAVAARTLEIAAGTIPQGTVAAQRTIVSGLRNGREFLQFRANWFCSREIDANWDLLDTGWRVTVDGDAPLAVDLRFPFGLDRMADIAPGYTANRAVNAVRAVCAAAPGIVTISDLPAILPDLG